MNRRNILRGVAQSNLSAPPASLIYHAVLCYTFAVSLSIIHETQIPFTFFRDFLKKVFGALSVSQSSTASGLNLSVTGFAVTAPLVGEVASSVSEDDGEVQPPAAAPGASPHQKAPPSLKGAMGALCPITMGSAYSALGASGAFASSAFAAGSA